MVVGPMGAGKTTELMRLVERATVAKRVCLVVKYSGDVRYTTKAIIQTHSGRRYVGETVACSALSELVDKVGGYDLIAIDEGQFFGDLNSFCREQADNGMDIVVAALDGNFKREGFPQVNALYAACDHFQKIPAICISCGADAVFTHRNIASQEEVVIGGMDLYEPVCRRCYGEKAAITETIRCEAAMDQYDDTV